MSQEDANTATVHRLYAASRRHDNEACVREMDREVEIVSYLMGVEGTVYRGHGGVRRYIDDLFSVFPDWHPEILRTTASGDMVLAEIMIAGRGAGSGLAVEQRVSQVSWFRDGKVIAFHGYRSRAEAVQAAGLAEHQGQ